MLTKLSFLLCGCVIVAGLSLAADSFAFGAKSDSAAAAEDGVNSSTLNSSGPSVWVTRPDGAQQCAPKSGETLKTSASELKQSGVRVLNSRKGSDNKLHAQMCGIPTGKTNMFEIPKEDLSKATALGFHEVKSAP